MDEAVVWLTIFVLSVFVGIEVISKVSSTLHTPLMSGANAIMPSRPGADRCGGRWPITGLLLKRSSCITASADR